MALVATMYNRVLNSVMNVLTKYVMCPECSAFIIMEPRHMEAHRLTHQGFLAYKCDKCNRRYSHLRDAKRCNHRGERAAAVAPIALANFEADEDVVTQTGRPI